MFPKFELRSDLKKLDDDVNIDERLIELAEKNDIIVPFMSKFPEYKYEEYKGEYQAFWNKASELTGILKKNDLEMIVIKSKRDYRFYDGDLNILVKNSQIENILNILESEGYTNHTPFPDLGKFLFEPYKIWLEPDDNGFPLHLHRMISWHGIEYIPFEEVKKNADNKMIEGHNLKIPSYKYETLIMIAHSLFENYHLTLGEFYHLESAFTKLDVKEIFELSKKFGLTEAFNYVYEKVYRIHNTLFENDFVTNFSINSRWEKIADLEFPYKFEIKELSKIWNKRAKYHLKDYDLKSYIREKWRHPSYLFFKRTFRGG